MRGIAALSVAWFHMTLGGSGWLKASGQYGWLGVEMFFVISGFVIPLALHRADYQINDYGRFIAKRLLRLDPPYIVSILLILFMSLMSPFLPGASAQTPFNWSPAQFLLHFGYLNVFFNYPWYNMVFWSLAIEFQFYLLVGLLFPVVRRGRLVARIILTVCLGVLALFIPSEQFIFRYIFLFLSGIVVYRYYVGEMSKTLLLALLIIFTAGSWLMLGVAAALTGLISSSAIAFAQLRFKPLIALGTISYSLYLIHVPVGYRVLNLLSRVAGNGILASGGALAVSILASIVFYKLVEKPAQRWASSVTLKRRESLLDRPAL